LNILETIHDESLELVVKVSGGGVEVDILKENHQNEVCLQPFQPVAALQEREENLSNVTKQNKN
jgi:hypothetical protein